MEQNIKREIVLVPTILSYFSLGIPTEILPIKEGISNHNYLAKTREDQYIVKFLMNQNVETIENDVAIQKQLNKVGIFAPEYLQNEDGTYIYREGDITAVISRKIDGIIPRRANPQLAQEFGRTLAAFHTCVTEVPHPNNTGLMNPEVSGIQSDIFSRALPKGVIHGDFHFGNALLHPRYQDRIIAMLDFEEAGENVYLVDIAVTIMGVCFSTDEKVIDSKLVQAAIRGYQSTRKLTYTEKSLFPEAIQYAAETWIKWFREHGYERYAEKHQGRLNSFEKFDFAQLYDGSEN